MTRRLTIIAAVADGCSERPTIIHTTTAASPAPIHHFHFHIAAITASSHAVTVTRRRAHVSSMPAAAPR